MKSITKAHKIKSPGPQHLEFFPHLTTNKTLKPHLHIEKSKSLFIIPRFYFILAFIFFLSSIFFLFNSQQKVVKKLYRRHSYL